VPCFIPEVHGSGTHPPMYSLAMWSLWKNDGNDKLMKRLIKNALAYDRYFENIRVSEQVPGLLVLAGQVHYDDVDWEMPVISVDVNAYSITEKYCLAEMCRACGMEEDAERLQREAAAREELVHKELWNEEKTSYFDRIEADGRFSPIVTPTNLSPFMLKNLPKERIEPMLEWLYDEKHFWGEHPLPSIAKSEPGYDPYGGYWMGPIWMSYPMDILRGLMHHDVDAASKLFDKLVNTMLPDGEPSIYENYNPETGVGICCPNFSWNGQIIDIIMRDMFGISYEEGKVTATSAAVPLQWDNWKVKNVVLHGKSYTVSGKKVDGKWEHEVVEN
jgi:glycogen debranching enzyme